MKENKTKANVFGVISRSPGQNLMIEITGVYQEVGIPSYNYGEMFKIFRKALDESEIRLICKGLGIHEPRKKQNEIAVELGIPPKDVSMLSAKAMAKLKASPYKAQLKKLMPTVSDLTDEIIDSRIKIATLRRDAKLHESSDTSLGKKCQNLQQLLAQATTELNSVKAENAKFSDELESANGIIEELKSQVNKLTSDSAKLTAQLKRQESRSEAIKEAFDEAMNNAKKTFILKVSDAEIKADTLEDLGLSKDIMLALKRARVTDIEALCKLSRHNLTKLGVKWRFVDEISKKLTERGLSLRAG